MLCYRGGGLSNDLNYVSVMKEISVVAPDCSYMHLHSLDGSLCAVAAIIRVVVDVGRHSSAHAST